MKLNSKTFGGASLFLGLPYRAARRFNVAMRDLKKSVAAVGELRARANAIGMTRRALCAGIGVSESTWNRWERGQAAPDLATWFAILRFVAEAEARIAPGARRRAA